MGFDSGEEIYCGYVDDPRNTDNAWMETVAFHFHCSAELGELLPLEAGDDAKNVTWLDVDESDLRYKNLYADQRKWLCLVKARPAPADDKPCTFGDTLQKTLHPSVTTFAVQEDDRESDDEHLSVPVERELEQSQRGKYFCQIRPGKVLMNEKLMEAEGKEAKIKMKQEEDVASFKELSITATVRC